MYGTETIISDWLEKSVVEASTGHVRAFCFNLYDRHIHRGEVLKPYTLELVGSAQFDENDPDWPSQKNFEPTPRSIELPNDFSHLGWEACLEKCKDAIEQYLALDLPGTKILKSVEAVGLGFVDGDLQLIWKK